MENWYLWEKESQIKRSEILKQAEIEGMLHRSRINRRAINRPFGYLLDEVEELLVEWGTFLRKRYGTTPN